jgi:hypothetical protein
MNFDGRQVLNVILLIFAVVVSTIYIIVPWFRADRLFVDADYHYKVNDIRIEAGQRGIADFLDDSVWRPLSLDESKIQKYVQVGDSIVKKSGSRKITVYRRDTSGVIEKREFE